MRLTLRTLLALRNKTLRPDDEAVLAEKVRGSAYAQSILESIVGVLGNHRISALPPTATGPIDDPNVMAEYVDSTLTPEQAAEVDRTCLESPTHLAEAAAAHEILTLVLGKPAEVPAALRDRVYQIRSASPSKNEAGTIDSAAAAIAAADTIVPVSLNDSGAYQAASRMESTVQAAGLGSRVKPTGKTEPAMAGSRPINAAEASEIFGDRIRFSRAIPWLVTLALVGGLLFVMKQAFAPVLNRDPNAVATATEAPEPDSTGLPKSSSTNPDASPTTPTEPTDAATGTPALPPSIPADPAPAMSEIVPSTPAEMEPVLADRSSMTLPTGSSPTNPTPQPETSINPMPSETAGETPEVREADVSVPERKPSVAPEPQGNVAVARASTVDSLLLSLEPDAKQWQSVSDQAEILENTQLVTPPLFRNRVTVPGQLEITFVGPTSAHIARSEPGTVGDRATQLRLQMGQMIVSALVDQARFELIVGQRRSEIVLSEIGTTVAIEVTPFRAPGTDPTNPENRVFVCRTAVVVGPATWQSDANHVLETDQQWQFVGEGDIEKAVNASPLNWIERPVESRVDITAKQDLLKLLPSDQTVELGLREATHFRRAEVVALAARTLAMLGQTDVYFGTDGMLSNAEQKPYWEDHVAMLQSRVDMSADSAAQVGKDAQSMDAASAEPLFRLLWGYSPEQLEAGADEFLVTTLDSPQMVLRVLACENLRRITGTTLYYRPEQSNAARRKADVKKWEARLRRDDIRWQAVPIAGVTPPTSDD